MRKKKPIKILITAGPTREYLDPVRFISSPSTGVMGYTLARIAVRRGHQVRLVSGPTSIKPPPGVKLTCVVSAREMAKEVYSSLAWCQCLIMSAAVCDYRPRRFLRKKMNSQATRISLDLVKNPDILSEVSKKKKHGQIVVGFALQTDNLLKKAKEKLIKKDLDLIVANILTQDSWPFGAGRTSVTIIDREGRITKLENLKKEKISDFLLDKVEELCYTFFRL